MNRALVLLAVAVASPTFAAKLTVKNKVWKEDFKDYASVGGNTPVFEGNSPMAKYVNAALDSYTKKSWKGVRDMAAEEMPALKKGGFGNKYGQWFMYDMYTATTDLVSFNLEEAPYYGGAHPGLARTGMNFYAVGKTVKAFGLTDLFSASNLEALVTTVNSLALKSDQAEFMQEGFTGQIEAAQMKDFAIDKKGFHFLFEPYELGSWAAGPITITVPMNEVAPLMHASWRRRIEAATRQN